LEKEIKDILNDKFIEKYFDKNYQGKSNKNQFKKRKYQHEKILMDAKIFEIDEKEIKKNANSK